MHAVNRKRAVIEIVWTVLVILVVLPLTPVTMAAEPQKATQTGNKDVLELQAMQLPYLADTLGYPEAASVAAGMLHNSNVPDSAVSFCAFTCQRLEREDEKCAELPPRIPFIWRYSTYIKDNKNHVFQILDAPVAEFYTLDQGILFIGTNLIAGYIDPDHPESAFYFDFNEYHSNPAVMSVSPTDFALFTTNQSSSAGGEYEAVILINAKTGTMNSLELAYEKRMADDCGSVIRPRHTKNESSDITYRLALDDHGNLVQSTSQTVKTDGATHPDGHPNEYSETEIIIPGWISPGCHDRFHARETPVELNFPEFKSEIALWEHGAVTEKETPDNGSSPQEEKQYMEFLSRLKYPSDELDYSMNMIRDASETNMLREISVLEKKNGFVLIWSSSEGAQYGGKNVCLIDRNYRLTDCECFIHHGNYGEMVISPDRNWTLINDARYMGHDPFQLINLTKLKKETPQKLPIEVHHETFSPSSDMIALIAENGQVWVYKKSDQGGFQFSHFVATSYYSNAVTLSFVDNDRLLIGFASGEFILYTPKTQRIIWSSQFGEEDEASTVPDDARLEFHLSPNKKLAVVQLENFLELLDISNGGHLSGTFDVKNYVGSIINEAIPASLFIKSITVADAGNVDVTVLAGDSRKDRTTRKLVLTRSAPPSLNRSAMVSESARYTGITAAKKRSYLLQLPDVRQIKQKIITPPKPPISKEDADMMEDEGDE